MDREVATGAAAPVRARKTQQIKAENERLLELSGAILAAEEDDVDVSKVEARLLRKNAFLAFIDRNLMAVFYCFLLSVFVLVLVAGALSTGEASCFWFAVAARMA